VAAISHIISELHSALKKYQDINYSCPQRLSFQCGSYLFGTLHLEMEAVGFLSPRPQTPFPGLTFTAVCSTINEFRSPSWYQKSPHSKKGFLDHSIQCSLLQEMERISVDSRKLVQGLNLLDVKKSQN
jgi:hypothetical protein